MSKRVTTLLCIDVDGTIADIRPRLKKAGPEPTRGKDNNRQSFQRWLDKLQNEVTLAKDPPILFMQRMLKGLLSDSSIRGVYLTGRSERYRVVTEKWLKAHRWPRLDLHMRADEDWRKAAAFKREVIRYLAAEVGATSVICIDDDGGRDCSTMYLAEGWTHLQLHMPGLN